MPAWRVWSRAQRVLSQRPGILGCDSGILQNTCRGGNQNSFCEPLASLSQIGPATSISALLSHCLRFVMPLLRCLLPLVFLCPFAHPSASLGQSVAARWDLASDQNAPEVRFGRSVAVSEDRVVVGATGDVANGPKSGAVYFFERAGGGWKRTKIAPPDGEPAARFGWKVGIDGRRIAVSAPWASNPVAGRSGTIYLYEKTGGAWQHQLLRVDDPTVNGQIGRGMAMDAGRIVIGAPFDTNANGTKAGALVVFEETPDGWTSQTLVPAQGATDGWFGITVAAGAGRIGAGVYSTRQASGAEAGAASVFERSTDGTWHERPLTPHVQPKRTDHFGRGLAFHTSHVFVGAEEDDNANGFNAGGVFALRLDSLAAGPRLVIPSDGAPRSYLGYTLTTTEHYLAVSEDSEVRLFALGNDGATGGTTLSTLMGEPLPSGVLALAGDGNTLVVGMPFANGDHPNTGTVWVVEMAP